MGIQPTWYGDRQRERHAASLCLNVYKLPRTMETKQSSQTIKEVIDFAHCKSFYQECSNSREEHFKAKYGRVIPLGDISLIGFNNPYEELKNVLAQHHNIMNDVLFSKVKEAKYWEDIEALTVEKRKLNNEIAQLKEELTTYKESISIVEAKGLAELLKDTEAKEWAEIVGDVLDSLIAALCSDIEVSDSLYFTRMLQDFFFKISNK